MSDDLDTRADMILLYEVNTCSNILIISHIVTTEKLLND